MKFIVVALFALVAVASALPAGPVDHTVDSTKGSKDDLKASEAVYVASPYAASPYVASPYVASYPAVTAYSAAVPAVSAYSAYPAAVPAVSAYSYGYAPSAYAYYYR